ncbi:helix-turn-helix domain-containing protein [Providencia rettgeri]|uniref:helix-turn-helix domain-containing protein n=1 Tax=Providencia rettgeri TaxID=587 RepID=UPI003015FB82
MIKSVWKYRVKYTLISSDGKTLWLSHELGGNFEIATLLSDNLTYGAQAKLYAAPIELHGIFYYLAPVYSHAGEPVLVVALSSTQKNCNILFALTQALAREASGKLKFHYYKQEIFRENKVEQRLANLDIHSVEKALIIEVAQACEGKIQKMHKVLNMGRTTLWRKLKQYEINIKDYK